MKKKLFRHFTNESVFRFIPLFPPANHLFVQMPIGIYSL